MGQINIKALEVAFTSGLGEGVTALSGVDLNVAEGEFLGVVGPSGCGKTTLLRVIAGLERPSAGTLHHQQADPKRPGSAMVFQDAGLFPWMSVLENVAYGMRMRGLRGKKRYERAMYWLGRVGLARFADAFPHQLSGGMRQRVGLARAFAYDADVLLMDEPFGALDAQTRLALQQSVLELWRESDITVVFVTHSIDEALTLADRVVVMSARPGRILAEYPVELPRPRDPIMLRSDPSFSSQYKLIWDVLRDEVGLLPQGVGSA